MKTILLLSLVISSASFAENLNPALSTGKASIQSTASTTEGRNQDLIDAAVEEAIVYVAANGFRADGSEAEISDTLQDILTEIKENAGQPYMTNFEAAKILVDKANPSIGQKD